jgi:hypothetical protein
MKYKKFFILYYNIHVCYLKKLLVFTFTFAKVCNSMIDLLLFFFHNFLYKKSKNTSDLVQIDVKFTSYQYSNLSTFFVTKLLVYL